MSDKSKSTNMDWHRAQPLGAIYTFASTWISGRLAYVLTPNSTEVTTRILGPNDAALIYALTATIAAYVLDIHDWSIGRSRMAEWLRCVLWAALCTSIFTVVVNGLLYANVGRWILLWTFMLSVCLIVPPRILMRRWAEAHKRRILFLGPKASRENFERLTAAAQLPMSFAYLDGAVDWSAERWIAEIDHIAAQGALSELVLGEQAFGSDVNRGVVAETFIFRQVTVSGELGFIERHLKMVPVIYIAPHWIEGLDLKLTHVYYYRVKRIADLLIASVALIGALPILAVAMGLIALVDGRPVILRQRRVGLYGRVFAMLKLRTMRNSQPDSNPQWTLAQDPRVLPLGRMLRRLRIDELPQLINIIQGTMTLVGPRPEIPALNERIVAQVPWFQFRYCIKPGLTGWAQIHAPYGASVEDASVKVGYDLFYIKNMSLLLDLQIVLRTMGRWMKGAR